MTETQQLISQMIDEAMDREPTGNRPVCLEPTLGEAQITRITVRRNPETWRPRFTGSIVFDATSGRPTVYAASATLNGVLATFAAASVPGAV